jgi:hypothetical protein
LRRVPLRAVGSFRHDLIGPGGAMAGLVSGWEFAIPVSKVSGLLIKQADLLEDLGS